MNHVFLIGRLTADPEVKYIQGDNAVTNFTLAVDRAYKNKNGNKEADFINCVAWNKTAELIVRYLNKGSLIAVDGSIQTGNYTAQDGTKRYTTEIKVDTVKFLGGSNKAAEKSPDSVKTDFVGNSVQVGSGSMPGFEEVDLDLPF